MAIQVAARPLCLPDVPRASWVRGRLPLRPVLLVALLLAACALLPWQAGWCCVLAAVIGLGVPHGALDVEVARDVLRPRLGFAWFVVFALPYLGLSALVLLAWRVAPPWALAGFLAASVWHFGSEDPRARDGLGTLVLGGLPVAVPALAHPAATALVLGTVAQAPLPGLATWLSAAALGWMALAVVWIVRLAARGAWRTLAVPGLVAGLACALPPLVAFAIYFVCVHAPAHTDALIAGERAVRVTDRRRAVLLALPVTGLTLLLGAALWPLYAAPVPVRLLAVTLQGLSALTLPHMVLDGVMGWRERRARWQGGLPQQGGQPRA